MCAARALLPHAFSVEAVPLDAKGCVMSMIGPCAGALSVREFATVCCFSKVSAIGSLAGKT